jgi:flagellar export protein FliJ
MPFSFRLQSLLMLRRQHERSEQRVVGRRLAAIALASGYASRVDQQTRFELGALRSATRAINMPVDQIIAARGWLGRLQRERLIAASQVAEHERQLVIERARLVDASKRRKVLEALRDRQLAEHRRAEGRAEDAFLDEVGLVPFVRREGLA